MRHGEPMITFFPIGRLGNVMFQAAACIGYAKKYNVGWGVPSNTREVPRFREFFPGLPECNHQFRSYNEHPGEHCNTHGVHKDQCHFNYHEIPFSPQGVKLVGFFQSWKYFENAIEEVKKTFNLPHHEGLHDFVSIHVRLTDYVSNSGSFPPVTIGYLQQAIDFFTEQGLTKFMVFSDDIPGAKNILCGVTGAPDLQYSTGEDEFTDLCKMASCGDHIIANSSFSYWAATLGHNQQRQVVTPSHKRGSWFGRTSGVKQDCVDLIPEHWIQIEWNK